MTGSYKMSLGDMLFTCYFLLALARVNLALYFDTSFRFYILMNMDIMWVETLTVPINFHCISHV